MEMKWEIFLQLLKKVNSKKKFSHQSKPQLLL